MLGSLSNWVSLPVVQWFIVILVPGNHFRGPRKMRCWPGFRQPTDAGQPLLAAAPALHDKGDKDVISEVELS